MPMIKTPKSSYIFFAERSITVVKQGSKHTSLVKQRLLKKGPCTKNVTHPWKLSCYVTKY